MANDPRMARRRAAVLVAMLVNEHSMQDRAAISQDTAEVLDGEGIMISAVSAMMVGMVNAGLARRACHYGNGDEKRDQDDWTGLTLTTAGRYAAEIMRGLLDAEGE